MVVGNRGRGDFHFFRRGIEAVKLFQSLELLGGELRLAVTLFAPLYSGWQRASRCVVWAERVSGKNPVAGKEGITVLTS